MSAGVEIPVRLTAWVQEGVVPLVVALSELEDVVIAGSCEGGPDRAARVWLRRSDGDALELAAHIGGLLAAHAGGIVYELRPCARAGAGGELPFVELACADHHVISLALALRASRRRRPADLAARPSRRRVPAATGARPRRRLRALATG